jgi:hypothetical protein
MNFIDHPLRKGSRLWPDGYQPVEKGSVGCCAGSEVSESLPGNSNRPTLFNPDATSHLFLPAGAIADALDRVLEIQDVLALVALDA